MFIKMPVRRELMEAVEHYVEKFQPEHYRLFLDINRREKRFTGTVAIKGLAISQEISLHQKGLEISSVMVAGQALDYRMDEEQEAVHIQLREKGEQLVELAFSGQVTDEMTGVYPSYYRLEGEKKEIISTQFESHFAHQVFPSVDEPAAKARFDLSLTFDQEEGDIALSNMPEIKVEERLQTGVWTFATTPRMSTYLLAFALGALHGQRTTTKQGTQVGVYATRAQDLASLDFSLNIAVRVIEFYEDYFGIAYPIPQCLHVALPDFSAGAMENWGLVTYREVFLLVDDNSSVASRQQVALVIAHEVAHQWFGNLVTMKWWDDLWLNESFANMMEYVAVDAIEPSWNILEDFQSKGIPQALHRDATDGVQSVHMEVRHPDEINTLFDPAIVYAKGSRLMHMLRRWLGDEAFSKGLQSYFQQHQYSNTVGKDLWDSLSAAAGRDVASFMEAWLEQPGYPLVTASLQDDQLILTQQQFFIGDHEDKGRLWLIPLHSNWTGLPATLDQEVLVIDGFSELAAKNHGRGPLLLNTGNTAHYIIDYQGSLLEAILENVANLDTISKLQLLQDRNLLAESGLGFYADLVPLLKLFQEERSQLVLTAVSQMIVALNRFLDPDSPLQEQLKAIVQSLFRPHLDRLGFEKRVGESDEDEMVRQLAVGNLIWADDAQAVAQARSIYAAYADQPEKIPADIRTHVLANQMKVAGSLDLIDQYLKAYQETGDSTYQADLGYALSYLQSEEGLAKVLSALKDKDIIKPQDLIAWYGTLLRRPFAEEAIWTWARTEWDWIKKSLGGDMSYVAFIIIPSRTFKSQQRLDEYQAFFEAELTNLALQRDIAMGIKSIAARIQMVEKNKAAVEKALADY